MDWPFTVEQCRAYALTYLVPFVYSLEAIFYRSGVRVQQWLKTAITPNLIYEKNHTVRQCTFLDLPSYTVYSATGSFFIPTILMFFVYFKIYQAFAKHRARQIYRQKVIRKHIESTILHEISHVLPTSDEFAKEDEDDTDDLGEGSGQTENGLLHGNDVILEESEEESDEKAEDGFFCTMANVIDEQIEFLIGAVDNGMIPRARYRCQKTPVYNSLKVSFVGFFHIIALL
ncbi:unnamed protein product [Angiostrongylus costaricensis]|uniref:G_PROTEIN_RECEP_F1_2 domain-containing protein n=1 Tax=Angiostrongylus costaricensis TaxID=334426 RepID=A0A0R3PGA9_ANGCS|nr:unnamed protein product [Angiostrongylus costaricensis]